MPPTLPSSALQAHCAKTLQTLILLGRVLLRLCQTPALVCC